MTQVYPRMVMPDPLHDSTRLNASFGREVKNPRTHDGTPKKLADFNPSGVAAAMAGAQERLDVMPALLDGLQGDGLQREQQRLTRELVLSILGLYRSAGAR